MTAAPRRVLFVTGEYPPMVGGLADHTACLRGALEDAGWSTAVLTSTDATPSTRVSAIVRRWDWSTCDRLRRAIRAHQPDLVHLQYQTAAYGMHPAICLVPYVLRATGGPPVVVQMHDLRLPYLLPKCAPLRRAVTRALLRWSSGIILTTRSDVDRVDRWLAAASAARLTPAGRPITRLIPIGANLEPNPPPGYDRAAFRGALGLDPETIVIAFFGLANQSKGLPSLIEALAAIHGSGRSAHLLIVGGSIGASDPTNRRAQNDLLRVIDDLGLRSAVTITGTLSPRDVSAHLLAADVAALPYRDGASFRRGSLLATLAHGLPLVTTRGPDPLDREVLGAALRDRENCRLVPPDDPAALAGVLTDLAADPTARAHLAAGAATLAEAFRWPAIAKQTAGLYEEVLAAKDERGTPTAGSEVTPRTTDD